MSNSIARWVEKLRPCQFCGHVLYGVKYKRVIVKRTWEDFYNPKGRYRFHEECLREALESRDSKIVDLALDVIRCVKYEAQQRRDKSEWRQMKLDMAKEASARLDSDLQELYG